MTTLPGYIVLLQDAEDVCGKLAEQLGYAGINVSLSKEQGSCALLIPRDQEKKARVLLADYFTASSRSRKDEDLENFEASFLQKTPTFMSSEEKLRSRSHSVGILIGISVLVLVTAAVCLFRGDIPQGIYYLVFGILFLVFALVTLEKVRVLQRSVREENAFTEKVTQWFCGTYTRGGIDKMIQASSPTEDLAELDIRRLECIRDYIRREYRIEDAAWLEYLTDKIFKIVFG